MYIIRLSGGLGNQLFQYAFGYAIREEFGIELKFARHNVGPNSPRDLILNQFIDDISFIDVNGKEVIIEPNNIIKRSVFRALGRKLIPTINESKLGYDVSLLQAIGNSGYFKGNWTSYKYFNDYKDKIRNKLLSGLNLKSQNLTEYKNIVSVHIRRTDFLLFSNMNVCTISYFNSAISFFKEKIGECKFMFFSDDINWVKENFQDEGYDFVSSSNNNPLSDFILMSKCNHHIVSNSSFSWWASFLSTSPDQITICPDRVLVDNSFPIDDYFPSDWIRIPVN